jgi:hypothetical protein
MLIEFIDSIMHGLHHDQKTKCRIKKCFGDQFWLLDAPIWLALGETFQDSRNYSISSDSDATNLTAASVTQERFQMCIPILMSNINLFRLFFGSLQQIALNQDDLVSHEAFFEALSTRLNDTLMFVTSKYCKSEEIHFLTQSSQNSPRHESGSIGSMSQTSSISNSMYSSSSSFYTNSSIGDEDGSGRNDVRCLAHTFQLIERQKKTTMDA